MLHHHNLAGHRRMAPKNCRLWVMKSTPSLFIGVCGVLVNSRLFSHTSGFLSKKSCRLSGKSMTRSSMWVMLLLP